MEKIDRATALLEFERFVEAWDIDSNVDVMNAEDKESFEQQKGRILNAVMSGAAIVDESGNIAYNTQYGAGESRAINFKVPTGAAYLTMDSFKERQSIHKLFSVLRDMTGKNEKTFSNMDARDAKFCMGVGLLFLGS